MFKIYHQAPGCLSAVCWAIAEHQEMFGKPLEFGVTSVPISPMSREGGEGSQGSVSLLVNLQRNRLYVPAVLTGSSEILISITFFLNSFLVRTWAGLFTGSWKRASCSQKISASLNLIISTPEGIRLLLSHKNPTPTAGVTEVTANRGKSTLRNKTRGAAASRFLWWKSGMPCLRITGVTPRFLALQPILPGTAVPGQQPLRHRTRSGSGSALRAGKPRSPSLGRAAGQLPNTKDLRWDIVTKPRVYVGF